MMPAFVSVYDDRRASFLARWVFVAASGAPPSHTMDEFLDPLSESTNTRFDPEAPEVRIDGMCQNRS
jgi:hypothetical protein